MELGKFRHNLSTSKPPNIWFQGWMTNVRLKIDAVINNWIGYWNDTNEIASDIYIYTIVYRSQQMPEKEQLNSLSGRYLSSMLSILTSIVSSAVSQPVSWSAFSHLNLASPLCWKSFRMLYRLESAQSFCEQDRNVVSWRDKLQVVSVLAAFDRVLEER